jgi:hypothetical protein
LDYGLWVDAIRTGRTFVTNGPLLEFRVNDAMVGDEVRLPPAGGRITLRVRMRSTVPVEKLEIIRNGHVVVTVPLTDSGRRAAAELEQHVISSGWFTLRAYGTQPVHPVDDRYPFAETNPIYVMVGGQPIRSREDAEFFLGWIDSVTKQAMEHSGWRSEKEKAHVFEQFREARQVFIERARQGSPPPQDKRTKMHGR